MINLPSTDSLFIHGIRNAYLELEDVTSLYTLYDTLLHVYTQSKADSLSKAYLGATTALMSQYAYAPWKRLNYFHEGVRLLEESIEIEHTAEKSFLRLLVQMQAPNYLKYNRNMRTDFQTFINQIDTEEITDDQRNKMKHLVEEAMQEHEVDIVL